MTVKNVARARKFISRKEYIRQRMHLMKQVERWWTEQFYMHGHHQFSIYPPDESWKQLQRFQKRYEYYRKKLKSK